MTEKKPAKKSTQMSAKRTAASKSETFTAEERAAMKERARGAEGGSRANRNKAEGERDVLAKIAARCRIGSRRWPSGSMRSSPRPRRTCGRRPGTGCPRTQGTARSSASSRAAGKFDSRYATFGFNDRANLDKGAMWPVSFALKELTAAEEAKITALVKKAVS